MADAEVKKPKGNLVLVADFFKLDNEPRMEFAKTIRATMTDVEIGALADDIRRIYPDLA